MLPDTAVRCDSDEAFICASSSSDTALVSPTDSPGRSPPPGSGRPRTTSSTNPRRSALATPKTCGGRSTTSAERAKIVATAGSPASVGFPPPAIVTRAPRSRPSGASPVRRTATVAVAPSIVADPLNRTPPRVGSTFVVTCTTRSRTGPSSASATVARAGNASHAPLAATAAAAQATAASASTPRRVRKAATRSAPAAHHTTIAAVPAMGGHSTTASAVAQVASATGTRRRSRITPSPVRATIRARAARCPTPRGDRPRP